MPALMIRLLSGVAIPFRFLWRGALLGGIALGLLKVLGSALLTSTGHNPLFTTFAVFVAILVWFNIVCRIYLLTAEWIATSMRDAGITPAETGWVITRQGIKNRLKR
jgi:membrane protein